MVLKGESLEKLRIGDRVLVVEAECGAKGAEGKIGVYIGMQNHFSISDDISDFIRGKRASCPYGYIIKTENEEYWNIGNDVKLEIIENIKELNKTKEEVTMEIRREKIFIKDFEISKSGRGVKVNFTDGTYKKTYALESDKFNLRRALFIAIAKKIESNFKYKDIEEVADAISIIKTYIYVVDDAIERYEKEKESKRIIANRKAKKIAYKERREARVREELIEIQKEAYLRAMREANK